MALAVLGLHVDAVQLGVAPDKVGHDGGLGCAGREHAPLRQVGEALLQLGHEEVVHGGDQPSAPPDALGGKNIRERLGGRRLGMGLACATFPQPLKRKYSLKHRWVARSSIAWPRM